jgi:hypothetical protein
MSTPLVRARCAELRMDADSWSMVSTALSAAAASIGGLTLGDKLGQIANLAGAADVITSYDQVRMRFSSGLAGGATALEGLSATLKQVADTYEREDREGAHGVAEAGR